MIFEHTNKLPETFVFPVVKERNCKTKGDPAPKHTGNGVVMIHFVSGSRKFVYAFKAEIFLVVIERGTATETTCRINEG